MCVCLTIELSYSVTKLGEINGNSQANESQRMREFEEGTLRS